MIMGLEYHGLMPLCHLVYLIKNKDVYKYVLNNYIIITCTFT